MNPADDTHAPPRRRPLGESGCGDLYEGDTADAHLKKEKTLPLRAELVFEPLSELVSQHSCIVRGIS